jgi:hypothetical protein
MFRLPSPLERPRPGHGARIVIAIATVILLLACEPGFGVGEPLTPVTEALTDGAVTLAVPLADGSLLIDDGTSLLIAAEGAELAPIGETGEVGELLAFAQLDGTTLIAGSEGTFVVQTGSGAGIFRAPIEDALPAGAAIHALAATPRPEAESDLWVVTDGGLYVFRDEALTEVRLEGIPLGGAQIAPLGPGALWAATSEAVVQVRIELDARTLSALRLGQPEGARSIAVDADGTLWLVDGEQIASLRRDLLLTRYALPFVPTRVLASEDALDVWLESDDGLHHQIDRVFRAVEGAAFTDVLAGPGGTLYARTATGVVLVRARHAISVDGLHDGPILEATRVEVLLPDVGRVTAVRAFAGDVELEVAAPTGTAPAAFVIEPGPVPVGRHELVVEADYDDGSLTASFRAPIEIATDATWANDIEPIYLTYCSDCHGERGPSPTRLDTREAWMSLSDRIIDNVQDGRMPLGRPMLPASDIALIQAWASGGFEE